MAHTLEITYMLVWDYAGWDTIGDGANAIWKGNFPNLKELNLSKYYIIYFLIRYLLMDLHK